MSGTEDAARDGAGRGVDVRRLDAEHAYVAEVDGRTVANLVYTERDDRLVLVETVVLPAMRGRGIATSLVAGALDDIRARGERIEVECPVVARFIARHPAYAELQED